MTDKVENILQYLEDENSIKILFAVESGSRVWGMASKDSDYDIRGVYISTDEIERNKSLLYQNTKCIDGFTEDRLYDWVLWDLATFLKFLRNNNPTAIDWILSTTTYRGKEEQEKVKEYFLSNCDINYYLFHHYGLVRSMYEKYVNPQRKTKRTIDNKKILNKIDTLSHNLDIMKISDTEKVQDIIDRSINELQKIKELTKKEYTTEDETHLPTTIKKILYVCRSALSIEYILQQKKFPSLNINELLHDTDLQLDFDKKHIADIITIKQNSNEQDKCICPTWLMTWYIRINSKVLENYSIKGSNKTSLLNRNDDDYVTNYIKYYIECCNSI